MMKAKIGGKTIEVPDERKRVARRDSRRSGQYGTYRSKLEMWFAYELERRRLAEQWDWVRYEPLAFRLANGVRYTPDFVVQHRHELIVYEVKGWSRNRRDGLTRLKWLAKDWPTLTCILVEYRRGAWEYTIII